MAISAKGREQELTAAFYWLVTMMRMKSFNLYVKYDDYRFISLIIKNHLFLFYIDAVISPALIITAYFKFFIDWYGV